MSGPKTASYTLTPEQRRRLLEQLQKMLEEQQRRERVAKEQKKLKALCDKAHQYITSLKEGINDESFRNSTIHPLEEALKESNKLINSDDIDVLKKQQEKIQNASGRLRSAVVDFSKIRKITDLKAREDFEKSISSAFLVALSYEKIEKKESVEENKYFKLIQEELEQIDELAVSEDLSRKLREIRTIAAGITSRDFLKNFYAMTICPYVEECKQYKKELDEYGDEYDQLVAKYKAMLIENEEEVVYAEKSFSMDALGELRKLVQEEEKKILDEQEQLYISQCIDEAMDEMGYSRVGCRDIVKRSGKKVEHKLYNFSEGTAVDVTYSEDGQITMELGAIDSVDRQPSPEEGYKLTEDMKVFCDHYKDLESILEQKGVSRKNISILPPSEEYAQVINVSKYDMDVSIDRYKVGHSRAISKPIGKHMGE